jgi:hypothetical protein
MLWSAFYLILSIILPMALVWLLFLAPLLGFGLAWEPLAYWSVVCWLLTVKYAVARPHMRAVERWTTWLLGVPLMILLQLFVLRPAMLHAIFKARSMSWGTRGSADGPHEDTSGVEQTRYLPALGTLPVALTRTR